jgi:hypothetical protein
MVKSFLLVSLLAVCGLSLLACQKEENHKSESINYSYTCNGCKTDEHTLDSKDAYCSGLLNESLNNSCCRNMREDVYAQQCK